MKVYGIFQIEYTGYQLLLVCATKQLADREMAQLQSMQPDIEYEVWEIPVIES